MTLGVEFTSCVYCEWFHMQLQRWHLLAHALLYGLLRLSQLGILTTAWHTYHSSTCKIRRYGPQFHPFFLRFSSYAHCSTQRILLAIIHAATNSSLLSSSISYSSHRIILYNFPLSISWRAVLTIWRSMSIISLHLIHDCICHQHHSYRHPHWHCTRHIV